MTLKIAGATFPDTVEEYIGERMVFTAAFLKFLVKVSADENLRYVLMNRRRETPQALYNMFFIAGAPRPVGALSGTDRKKMTLLAQAGDWSRNSWGTLLEDYDSTLSREMENNFGKLFCESPDYFDLVVTVIGPKIKKIPPALFSALKLSGNKEFCKDKNLLSCVKYTRMAALLEEKNNKKLAAVEKISSAAFEKIKKKHGLTLKYADWKKAVKKAV